MSVQPSSVRHIGKRNRSQRRQRTENRAERRQRPQYPLPTRKASPSADQPGKNKQRHRRRTVHKHQHREPAPAGYIKQTASEELHRSLQNSQRNENYIAPFPICQPATEFPEDVRVLSSTVPIPHRPWRVPRPCIVQVVGERYIAGCLQLAQTYDQFRRTNQGEQRYHLMRYGRNIFQITVIKTFLQAFAIQPGLGSKTFEDRLRSLSIVTRKGGKCREVITMW